MGVIAKLVVAPYGTKIVPSGAMFPFGPALDVMPFVPGRPST